MWCLEVFLLKTVMRKLCHIFQLKRYFGCIIFSSFLFVYFLVSEKAWSFHDRVLPDARIQVPERRKKTLSTLYRFCSQSWHVSFMYIAVYISLFPIKALILENNSYSVPLTLMKFHLDIGIVLCGLVPL